MFPLLYRKERKSSESGGKHRTLVVIGISAWLVIVVIGMASLWKYSITPGTAGTPPAQWPYMSRIPLAHDQFTLVMTAHPQCPCTRASLGELAMVMAHAGSRMRAYVLFVRPSGLSERLVYSDLWSAAQVIPGVTAVVDDGTEARRFDAATSGQTMVYDRGGRLVFSGGITAARGHWGDNAGVDTITALTVRDKRVGHSRTPVFGCALFGAPASR